MPETNKIVAAILTSGRMQTQDPAKNPRENQDWLAEYEMWVETLEKRDEARKSADASGWARNMASAIRGE